MKKWGIRAGCNMARTEATDRTSVSKARGMDGTKRTTPRSRLRCSGDRTGARRRSREVWLVSSIRPPRSRTARRRFVPYQLTWRLRAAGAGALRCQTALACLKWRPFSHPVFELFFNSFTVLFLYDYYMPGYIINIEISMCNEEKKVPERATTLFRGWHGTDETWFRMGPCETYGCRKVYGPDVNLLGFAWFFGP
jgi:hypothetical protein